MKREIEEMMIVRMKLPMYNWLIIREMYHKYILLYNRSMITENQRNRRHFRRR